MTLTAFDNALWAAGALLNAVLISILLLRRQRQTLPWFTGWTVFGTLFTLLLFASRHWGPHRAYTVTYWSGAVMDLVLQVGVVLEIARVVLRRSGRWVESAGQRFLSMAVGATLLAFLLTFAVKPLASDPLTLWTERGTLFTAVFVCLLFTAVVAVSQQFGLDWRSQVMHVGYGLTVWELTSFIVETLHAYFGPIRYSRTLDHIEMFVFVAAQAYWILAFVRGGASPAGATPSEKKQYVALRKELQFPASGPLSSPDRLAPK